jgi:hypothetical protein
MNLPAFPEKEFDERAFTCHSCQWNGKGHEAVIIDFYGVSDTREAHCPSCDRKIALVQKNKGGNRGESANGLSFQFG